MPETRLIDPIADPEWLELVERSPTAEVFHHPRWLELLQLAVRLRAAGLLCRQRTRDRSGDPDRADRESSHRAAPRLPPVLRYLLAGSRPRRRPRRARMRSAKRWPRRPTGRAGAHRPRRRCRASRERSSRIASSVTCCRWPTTRPRSERRYSKSQISADQEGAGERACGCERRTDAEALDAFYSLHLKTRRRLGVPTQPKRFIRRFERLFDAGLGFVWTDPRRGASRSPPPSSSPTTAPSPTSTVPPMPAHLGKRPNNLLFSEVIRWACEAGFRTSTSVGPTSTTRACGPSSGPGERRRSNSPTRT